MISLAWTRPSQEDQVSVLKRCKKASYNYDQKYIGSTIELPTSDFKAKLLKEDGYMINYMRVKLGCGEDVFSKGRDLLQNWRHFQLGWAFVPSKTQIKVGERFCVCSHELLTWILNPLEIVYIQDNKMKGSQSNRKQPAIDVLMAENQYKKALYSFGSGTIDGHLLAGEERFSVEWDQESDTVWYEICSFSKPAHFLSKFAYPYVQLKQRIFAKQSTEAMLKATRTSRAES